MSQALTQKLGSLQSAEKELSTSLESLLSKIRQEKLKKIVQSVQQSSATRTSTLESVAKMLDTKLESQPNPAISGVIKELKQSSSSPGLTTDINLATSLQKLLSLLLADYSFAANIAYEQNKPAQAINPLIEQYQQLQIFNHEVTNTTMDLFRQMGESSSSSPKTESSKSESQPQSKAQSQSKTQQQSNSQKPNNSPDSQKQKSGLLYDAREKLATAAQKVSESVKPE